MPQTSAPKSDDVQPPAKPPAPLPVIKVQPQRSKEQQQLKEPALQLP